MKPTPLTEEHRKAGAKLIDFAGYEMPIQYENLMNEHLAVRNSVGIFDLTHMGEFLLRGENATKALSRITSNNPETLQPGQIQYSLLTNEKGGILDDILVYRLDAGYMLVVNAANKEKDYAWVKKHCTDVILEDISDSRTLIAIQGPDSLRVTSEVLGVDLAPLSYYAFSYYKYQETEVLVSRTGYTGEDGFEIYLPNEIAVSLWRDFLSKPGVTPVGLGARDTLRLEARMPLYGNDIGEDTTAVEANLMRFVDLEKEDFLGKEALLQQKKEGAKRKLVGFVLKDKGIPRKGYVITNGERVIGEVTSGSLSPSRKDSIGLGYVETEYAKPETAIWIGIRKNMSEATIVKGRFVKGK